MLLTIDQQVITLPKRLSSLLQEPVYLDKYILY